MGEHSFLLKLLHRRAAVIIANSQAVASELVSKASVKRHNIRVIYNPVDFKIFDPEKVSHKQSRRNLKISDEDFVIGFVGRLHVTKGVDTIIKAMPILLEKYKYPHFLLVLAGDGPERKHLERLTTQLGVANRVRFLGMCDNVPEIMATFNAGIVASRNKPFGKSAPGLQLNWGGMVAAELMRMKIPVISSGKEGLSELVKDRVTGLLVHEDSPEEIVAAINCLISNKKLQKEMIDNAFNFSKQFDASKHARDIDDVYNDILRNPSKAKTKS